MTELQTLAATSGASSLPDVDFHRVELLICVLFCLLQNDNKNTNYQNVTYFPFTIQVGRENKYNQVTVQASF